MPHWLVFVITLLALSAPIGALLLKAWLAVVRPADLIVSTVELAYIEVATILIGTVMSSYVHRVRRVRRAYKPVPGSGSGRGKRGNRGF